MEHDAVAVTPPGIRAMLPAISHPRPSSLLETSAPMRFTLLPAMALSALLLAGCSELRAPRASQPVPTELLPANEEPVRAAANLTARDFADQGAALQGRPAEAARAIARLEWLTATLSTDPRYAALPEGIGMSMRAAAAETRGALGIVEDTPPAAVTASLSAIARALEAGATPAFPAAIFPAGAERSLQRLTTPGPLPQAGIATGRAAEMIAELDRDGGWSPTAGMRSF
ncbi:MAG: hypothetical protein JWP20_2061 [Roseomonas sp.]|jgi:hypothetical protein|nr:hypothetical protein [Roseomonas sp.]